MKGKKANTPIGILILVVMSIILCSFTLLSFHSRNGDLSELIGVDHLSGIYSKEVIINYYINNIIEKSSKGLTGDLKTDFINNMKSEIVKYKDEGSFIVSELSQVDEQINNGEFADKININDEIIEVEFNIKIKDEVINEKRVLKAEYEYTKVFSKKYEEITVNPS